MPTYHQNRKVLFIIPSLRKGGAERVLSLLLNAWSGNKTTCHLMLTDDSTITYDIPESVHTTILSHHPKNGLQKLMLLPFNAYKIAKYAHENDIDTIVSFLYRPNYSAVMSRLFGFKGKVIINIRSTTSRYLQEGLLGKVNLFLIRKLFNKADLIISNSMGVKHDLETLMPVKTRHIAIPNPVDLATIDLLKHDTRDIAFIPQKDTRYIISVGRLIPLKRHKDLIDAFASIHTKLPNTRLLLLGDGILKEALVSHAKASGIDNKIDFLGNVDNPFYYLHRSDLFVMTSEIEGFPNVLVEAMACGKAVISSNCKSGPAEILDNGKYGLLYEVGDVKTLSGHIEALMQDDETRKRYEKLAKERVREYDIYKVLSQFEKEVFNEET